MADVKVDGEAVAPGPGVDLGHQGQGDDCMGKTIRYAGVGGLAGAAFGTVEGCFVPASANSPMLLRAAAVILQRSVLLGTVGGSFATGACLSAKFREKDDLVNAFVGGALAGSVFGIKYRMWSLGIGLAMGIGASMAIVKYRHGSYLPPLPDQYPASPLRQSSSRE